MTGAKLRSFPKQNWIKAHPKINLGVLSNVFLQTQYTVVNKKWRLIKISVDFQAAIMQVELNITLIVSWCSAIRILQRIRAQIYYPEPFLLLGTCP